MALFIGRIPRDMGTRDLEDRFSKFGKITRLDVKQGFGFVEFEDKRDAEDAMNGVNESQELVVEWAKNGGKRAGENECFHCGKEGHWARDCRERGRGGDRGDRGYGSRGGRDRSPRRDQGRGSDRDRRGGRDYDRRRDDRGRDRSPRRDDYRSDERRGGDRRERDREYAAPREDRERREDVERAPERDVHDRD